MPQLIRIKAGADELRQLYFQLERVWFYVFREGSKSGDVSHWFDETARKSPALQRLESGSDWKDIERGESSTGKQAGRRQQTLAEAHRRVQSDWDYWMGARSKSDAEGYLRIRSAAVNAMALSKAIEAVLDEIARFAGFGVAARDGEPGRGTG